MGKYIVGLLIVAGLLFSVVFSAIAMAEPDGQTFQINGQLQTDNSYLLEDDYQPYWYEYRLDLKTQAVTGEKSRLFTELWIRSFKYSEDKCNFDLREAYLDWYGFLTDKADLRIGRQRIAWGVGDKLNPTDNLNPDDFENMWDFGRCLESDAVKISCYSGDCTITGVIIPKFKPAVLPAGDRIAWAESPELSPDLPPGITWGEQTTTEITPSNNLKNAIYGIKIAGNIRGYDLSASYIRGRDDLPVARKVEFTPGPGGININSELIYPITDIFGFDIAGVIGNVGVWAETAIFYPEKVILVADSTLLGAGIQESVALDGDPYVKYLLGMDYTFSNGQYLNLQYLHGFSYERGDDLEDYLVLRLESKFKNERLIIPLNLCYEIKDTDNLKNNSAVVFAPELVCRPGNNTEYTIGVRLIDGSDNTAFGRMKNDDQIYFKFNYSF
jgi:hypothetical protein